MSSTTEPQPTIQENKYSMVINQKENYQLEIKVTKKINIKI